MMKKNASVLGLLLQESGKSLAALFAAYFASSLFLAALSFRAGVSVAFKHQIRFFPAGDLFRFLSLFFLFLIFFRMLQACTRILKRNPLLMDRICVGKKAQGCISLLYQILVFCSVQALLLITAYAMLLLYGALSEQAPYQVPELLAILSNRTFFYKLLPYHYPGHFLALAAGYLFLIVAAQSLEADKPVSLYVDLFAALLISCMIIFL